MNQRPTQTLAFWQSEFSVTDEAIEALYNSFLELGVPRSIDDIGLFFVQHALDAEERAIQAELQQGKVYRPDQRYAVDEQLVFPQFDYSLGRVTGVRPGYNPVEGEFVVMDVEFESPGKIRASFAAELKSPHALSDANGQAGGEDGLSAAQKIYGQFQYLIRPKIDAALRQNAEFVAFRTDWFLAGLLVEVQEGLLNIVDAAIDINTAPLNVDALIEQIDLLDKSPVNETLRFSVNYRLANDSRFINVGTDEHDLWYLNRLKPQQVMEVPHNLLINKDIAYDVATMPGEFRTLLAEIDDEASPVEYAKPVDPDSREALFVLTYPHRRCGTLPVLHSMQPL
ncbi:MAG: hypothetical protein ACE5G8_08485, partial [Anaerolineae bacterium]